MACESRQRSLTWNCKIQSRRDASKYGQSEDHPHPNRNGSYGINNRARMPCFRVRMAYFRWKSLDFKELQCHTDPHRMAYFGGIFFANMGSGGQNCFQNRPFWEHRAPNMCLVEVYSDTKLLLTKNYSEIIVSQIIMNFIRNSLKKSSFPGDFEGAKTLKDHEKEFSGSCCS